MGRIKIILKYFITIALLILIPLAALCCEKESPLILEEPELVSDIDGAVFKTIKIVEHGWITENLNVSHFMQEDFIREANVPGEWGQAGIGYELVLSLNNSDSENRVKTGKQDNRNIVYDPIGFDVFLFALVVFAVSFILISGIMSYKIISDNPVKNFRKD